MVSGLVLQRFYLDFSVQTAQDVAYYLFPIFRISSDRGLGKLWDNIFGRFHLLKSRSWYPRNWIWISIAFFSKISLATCNKILQLRQLSMDIPKKNSFCKVFCFSIKTNKLPKSCASQWTSGSISFDRIIGSFCKAIRSSLFSWRSFFDFFPERNFSSF